MAKALGFCVVFQTLMAGGFIDHKQPFIGRSSYKVSTFDKKRGYGKCIGHITESQFISLLPLLLFIRSIDLDDYSSCHLYCLDSSLIDYELLCSFSTEVFFGD